MSAHEHTAAALASETLAAFDWLADGLHPDRSVSFIPNPGNIGDAAINLACWRWLTRRFRTVEVLRPGAPAAGDLIFVGGGGNLVEPLYVNLRRVLPALPASARLFLFPSTLFGYAEVLRPLAGRLRVICREPVSLAFAQSLLPAADLRLAHDAAFTLAGALPGGAPPAPTLGTGHFFRRDKEAAQRHAETSDGDPAGAVIGNWSEPAAAETAVAALLGQLARHRALVTDRLHVAILGALLGRAVELRANSYFKNQAVFEHSLRRLPGLSFVAAGSGSPDNDPLRFLLQQAQVAPRRRGLTRVLGRT